MRFARVGLIANPSAGRGDTRRLTRDTLRALAPREVWVGSGEMGAYALDGLSLVRHIVDWSGHQGKVRTAFITQSVARENVDAFVVVGGDGTMADVALALNQAQRQALPILGIGAGSANVGPLVTLPGAQVGRLAQVNFRMRPVDGLIAGANDADLGLAFNDVVIDFTVLATVDGILANVDAARKMDGVNVPRKPEPVCTPQTRVTKRAPRGETLVAEGDQAVTIIAGLPDERFYGKAIAGAAILSASIGDAAGCLVCSHLLVTTHVSADALHHAEPIVSRYVGLNELDRIEVTGLRQGAALCADGNPLRILNSSDRVQIRVQRGLATAVKIEEAA